MKYLTKGIAILVSVVGMSGIAMASDLPDPQPVVTETPTVTISDSCVGARCCDLLTGMTGRQQVAFLARHPYCDQPENGDGNPQREIRTPQ